MKKINECFICVECGKEISLAAKTCRNHCPFCFTSLHVDGEVPGDRASACKGMMYPIAYELKNSDYKILFRCAPCGKEHWNKRAEDDEIVSLPILIGKYKERFMK
ncbi:MAG: RNHCP domain-containing protein [Candidatus Absconditabacteria bacterium]|nr:RNHCP domain-containing protein [Candidatus Absconditabacteria bacterium]MDD3868673.1 RNHCP domain-containing protein [Candidatus Absconditabacteria bacterium]MDD4714179.1 RNHCP domain-containing protein [Candidatus Absconditabacteria bacterium]